MGGGQVQRSDKTAAQTVNAGGGNFFEQAVTPALQLAAGKQRNWFGQQHGGQVTAHPYCVLRILISRPEIVLVEAEHLGNGQRLALVLRRTGLLACELARRFERVPV